MKSYVEDVPNSYAEINSRSDKQVKGHRRKIEINPFESNLEFKRLKEKQLIINEFLESNVTNLKILSVIRNVLSSKVVQKQKDLITVKLMHQ